jgi:transcriptional regulator with XRE-family HTH domain
MTTIKKARRVSSPTIKKLLAEAPALMQIQNRNRVALACRIDDIIKEKGFNYSSFASKLDKQPSVISKWLSGTHNFTVDTLDEIAFHLGVATAFLMQPQPVQVIYRKTVEVVTRVIEIDRNYKSNIQGHNRFQSNWNVGQTIGLPYASLTAKA